MAFCVILLVICSVLFTLDVASWNTQYITIASTGIFIVAEIVLMNLEQLHRDKMRDLERRVGELENKSEN